MDEQTTRPRERLTEAQRLLLRKRLAGAARPAAPPAGGIRRRDGGPVQPMSWNQERLWFLDQLEPGNPFYNIPAAVLVSADVDVALLERAFTEVVHRHESLRTVFRLVDGEPRQIIQPPYPVHVEAEDLRGPGGAPPDEDAIRRRIIVEGARPFDLAAGPLLRVKLLRVSDADYALFINVHHIVTDGWSMPIVMREMEQLYEAYGKGLPSPLPELEIQYADYAAWQRETLQGERLQRQLDYWRGHLEGAPTLELPTDRPRPPVASYKGALHRFMWPASLAERLRRVGVETGSSLNMVILAGFYLTLRHYSGQDDLVVGTLLGNRHRAELEPVVGFFVNSAPIRARVTGGMTFRDLVRQVRTSVLDADAHQELTFDRIVDGLKVPRDPARNPLFQVMYFHHTFVKNYHHLDDSEVASELNIRSLFQETGVALVDTSATTFDLTFATMELRDGLGNMLEYSSDLWDEPTVVRMMEHCRVLLERAAADVDAPVDALSPVADAERERLLAWGADPGGAAGGDSVIALFARQARATPDAVAVVAGDVELTYRALDERASRLAARLRAAGAGPETRVAVHLERGPEWVAALLGVLKAGAVYVPLEPDHPAERLRWMLDDSAASVLVARGGVPAALAGFAGAVVDVGAEPDAAAGPRVDAAPHPAQLAYVIYTSGSTGRPKGVAVEHGAAAAHCRAAAAAYGITAADRVLQFASSSFDVSLEQLLVPLAAGARVVLRGGDAPSPAELAALVRARGLTVLDLPGAYWRQVAADGEALAALRDHARLVLVGGEAMSPDTARGWMASPAAGVALVNAYGPTETVVTCTAAPVPADLPGDAPRVGIGRPLPGRSAYVLDGGLRPCGVGVPGELCIGGTLARGYLGRAAATAERFVPDPFGSAPGARLYRTGDRARWREDGTLDFLGRLDEQVKVRGFRIEPGEVEAALRQHPAVADCAVIAREDAPGERRLVAYLAGHDAEALRGADFRPFLRERLPDYMVPAAFVALDGIPTTASGKVDRERLPAPGALPSPVSAEPRTEVERALAEVWAEVLRLERIGIHDNFFAVGGDSILSIQIVARAAQRGIRVQARQMFVHQTIAELAAVAGQVPAARAEQGAVTGPAPLTPVQRWFFARELPEPHHDNLALAFELRDVPDAALLERAAAAVLAHHDALRTRFRRGPEGWAQENAGTDGPVPFQRFDLSAVAADERERAVTERAAALQSTLDLEAGPLVRFALFELGPERLARLVVIAHHLVVDAVSWEFVAADLESAYRRLARGEAAALPAKTTPFRDWARRLDAHARSGAVQAEQEFWLAQAPSAPLPRDGDGGNTEGDAARVTVALSPEETAALLLEVPPVYGTRIDEALLAALARAFRGWTGCAELCVDLEAHGREELFDDVDVSRTAGWFTAIHPLRLAVPAAGSPGDELKAVKEQLRAVPSKGIGYGLLRWMDGDAGVREALAAVPAPQVAFNYLGQVDGAAGDEPLFLPSAQDAGPTRSPRSPRSHLLEIDAAVSEGQLQVTWTYAPGVHRTETVERLAAGYLDALRELVAHCRDPQAGGYTPSDFDLAGLDQAALDAVLSQLG